MRKKMTVLVLAVLVSVICSMPTMTVLADGWLTNVEEIELNETFKDVITSEDDFDLNIAGKAYKFMIPVDGNVTIKMESKQINFFMTPGKRTNYYIYRTADVDKDIWHSLWGWEDYEHSSARNVYYVSKDVYLKSGTYYFVMEHNHYNEDPTPYTLNFKFDAGIPSPSITKVTVGKKAFVANWEKISGVSGYEIQYSTNRKFSSSATETAKVKSARKTKQTIKKLKSNKYYYVRVRAYKTMKGMTYRTGWSKIKRVKTK